MKISILNPDCIGDDKKGIPVYISQVVQCQDLYDMGLLACHHHIAIGQFANNYRKGDNWRSAGFLGIDFDDGILSAKSITEQLTKEKINHVILASKNHLKDKGDGKGIIERFHVFIPFDETLTEPELYGSIACNFVWAMKWKVDMATTKDKCRYYYQHREVLHVYEDGSHLSVEHFRNVKREQDKLKAMSDKLQQLQAEERQKRMGALAPVEQFKRTKYYRLLVSGTLHGDGNRYHTSSQIIAVMIKCGMDKIDALTLFDANSTYGEGFTRDSIEYRFQKWS